MARVALRCAIFVGLLALLPACATASSPAPPPDFFGMNAGTLFDQPQSEWGKNLDAMRDGGIRVVRTDTGWAQTEPQPPRSDGTHVYDWSKLDAIAGALASRGLRWYPIVDYSAPWAARQPGNFRSPPADPADFATFARALVERYGHGGSFWAAHPELSSLPVDSWEIWNEENGGYFWTPGPDPAGYVELYLAARAQIRAADPRAKTVVGGLVNVNGFGSFLKGMYDHRPEVATQIDAVAFHPYAPTVNDSINWITGLRKSLQWVGTPDIPIEVTEIGWTTQGLGAVSEETRVKNYADLATQLTRSDLGVTRVMPFAWMTRERWPQPDDWFGIVHPDGRAWSAGRSYLDAVRGLVGPNDQPLGTGAPPAGTTTTRPNPTATVTVTVAPPAPDSGAGVVGNGGGGAAGGGRATTGAGTVTLALRRGAVPVRGRTAVVSVRYASRPAGSWRGRLVLSAKTVKGGKAIAIGSASVSNKQALAGVVRVTLSKAAVRTLARTRSLRATATATVSGSPRAASARLQLKRG